MADRVLKQGDNGDDVKEAQACLNRDGAMLTVDGSFGGGTDKALRECQAAHALAATGQTDAATWAMLRGLPEPNPDIATAAVSFIAQQEVSSRAFYDRVVALPSYPGGPSGITIGVGYDLRFETADFETDWLPLLPAATIDALRPTLGQQGTPEMAAALAGFPVPWAAAWTVFIHRSLPKYVTDCRTAFAGFDALSPLCRGVLVSLVYNRGSGMVDHSPGDRQEMRDIRDALLAGEPQKVPDALRAMKRLWPNTKGLRDRRDAEAALFEQGLASPTV